MKQKRNGLVISLIMPFYNRYDLVHKRLYEFWNYISRDQLEIILINDASTEERDYEGNIAWWQKTIKDAHKIRYHVNKTNMGFGGSMNLGAKHANGDILVFFSTDVVITGDFVSEIKEKFSTNNKMLLGGEFINYPAGWNEFELDDERNIFISYLNGWLLSATKQAWEESEGFDPIYYPFDYEDVDISTRFTEMGYNLVNLNSRYLHHMGGATISSAGFDRSKYTRAHRELYISKWKGRLLEIYEKQRK